MSTTASKPKVLPAIGIVLRMLGQMPRSHSPSFFEEGGSTAHPDSLGPGPRCPEARVGEGIHRSLFPGNLGPEAWGRHGEGGSTASPPLPVASGARGRRIYRLFSRGSGRVEACRGWPWSSAEGRGWGEWRGGEARSKLTAIAQPTFADLFLMGG